MTNSNSNSNLFPQVYRLQTLEEGNTSIITVKLEKKVKINYREI